MERAGTRRKFVVIFTAAFTLSVGFLLILSGEGESMGSPAVNVDLYQERIVAEMEDEGSSDIFLNGTVTAQVPWSPQMQSLIIELKVLTEGLNWVFEPNTLTFTKHGPRTQNFDLTLSVPVTYPGGETSLEIGGRWRYSPGSLGGYTDEDHAIMIVTPLENGRISAQPEIDLLDGEPQDIQVSVWNTGNVDNYYHVEMDGEELLENVGVELEIEDGGYMELEYGEETEIELHIRGYNIPDGRTFFLTLDLVGADSGERYDSATITIETMKQEEPKDDKKNEEPPAGGDDDDDDDDGDAPSDPPKEDPDDEEDVDTSMNSGPGFSSKLIGYIVIVLILAGVAILGIVYYTKKS